MPLVTQEMKASIWAAKTAASTTKEATVRGSVVFRIMIPHRDICIRNKKLFSKQKIWSKAKRFFNS